MRKFLFNKTAVLLIVLLVGGYLAYDNYFRLPFDKSETNAQQANQENPGPEFEKFNILILGVDGRQGVNDRTDTIILASLDGETNEAQLLSIPRDTRVKIKGAWDKINAAYAYGGLELTKETVTDFLGIQIDRYAIVDFSSLVSLVDEIGGIEVNVPVRMYVPLEGIDLKPGLQHLNGEQVLAYSRFRGTENGDIDRAKRQQEIIQLLAKEIISSENLTKLPALAEIVKENVQTDLTVKEMIALARIAPKSLEKGINTQVLPGKNKKIDGIWYWEPDLAALDSLLLIPGEKNVASASDSSEYTKS